MYSSRELHRVIPDPLLYITTVGRKSFEKHVVKVRFVVLPIAGRDCICVLNAGRFPDWLANALSGEARLRSREISATVTKATIVFDDPQLSREILTAFEEKYGKEYFELKLARFYSKAKPVIFSFETRQKGEEQEDIQSLEFDLQARRYTSYILANPVSRWEREVTIQHLSRYFAPGETVLEVGCGTGIETIPLAKRGVEIVSTDISEAMLQVLRERAVRYSVEKLIRTRRIASSAIKLLEGDPVFPQGGFDGAFSTFGAMSLEPDLGRFAEDLASILKSKSFAIFGVWNKTSLADLLAQISQRRISIALQRLSGYVKASDETPYSLDSRTYSPNEFARFFAKDFEKVSYFAIPALIPPPSFARTLLPLLRIRRADFAIGKLPVLRALGDNFLITLRRK